jgi:uncharacterized delta-60 repeat protein
MAVLPAVSASEVLPDNFPELSTQAWIREAEIAPDGSVFLLGNFTAVDGVPRPGLAKLTPTGTLDPTFAPLEVGDLSQTDEFGSTLIFGLGAPPRELFALSRGGIMRTNFYGFEVRNPDGSVADEALQDLRDGISAVRPQFEQNGKLWLVARAERVASRIVVRDSQTLAPLAGFDPPADLPEPPLALAPATDGKVWVLGRSFNPIVSTSYGFSQNQVLYRLNSDGSLDETFPPEELPTHLRYQFEPSSGPGVVLSRTWPRRWQIWPGPSEFVRTFEFRDQNGILLRQVSLRTSLGIQEDYLIREDELFSPSAGFSEIRQIDESGSQSLFALDLAAMPPITTALDHFPNGDLLLGGTRRVQADGTPSPGWQVARVEERPSVERLLPLRNGEVLAQGNFDLAAASSRLGAVRLQPDGSLDPSFSPEIDLRRAIRVEEKTNGHFLVLMRRPEVDDNGQQSRLLELDTTGALVQAISIDFAKPGINLEGELVFPDSVSLDFALQSDDSVILQVSSFLEISHTTLWRIPSDDPENPVPFHSSQGLSFKVIPLPDDRLLIGNDFYTAEGEPVTDREPLPSGSSVSSVLQDGTLVLGLPEDGLTRYHLWSPDDGVIEGFENTSLARLRIWSPSLQRAARGKYFASSSGGIVPASYVGAYSANPLFSNRIVRLHADGSLDPSFEVVPGPGSVLQRFLPMTADDDSSTVWGAGNFSEVNGEPRQGLAIIADNQASGFQEWMRACAGVDPDLPTVFDEKGDEDGDGFTNLFEYAAGSHPVQRLLLPQGLIQTGPLTWQVSCNPEAPEILRRLEVSDDLIDWRPAQAADLRLETGLNCLSWSLQPGKNRLHCRLKVSQ